MARKERPSIEYLNECFDYDPESGGVLTWKERPVEHFSEEHRHRAWNTAHAGKVIGSTAREGYTSVRILKRTYNMHAVCFAIHHSRWANGAVDHKDADTTNNKIGNLREATKAQNGRNRGENKNNTSGYKGVYYHKKSTKWRAIIGVNGEDRYLGYFHSPLDAYFAYCYAALELHGDFRKLWVAPAPIFQRSETRIKRPRNFKNFKNFATPNLSALY